MNGLTFFLMVAGPGLVLILNHLSIKRVPVTQPQLDWGTECLAVHFQWPATERLLAPDAHVASSKSMSGVERKPPRSVAGGTA